MNLRKLIIMFGLAAVAVLGFLSARPALAATDCTFTTSGTTMYLDADCTTDETIFIPDGFTLDGQGHTITAEDPPAGHFTGAVVQNGGATAHVTKLVVTTTGLANVCEGGDDRLRGIMFDGASGSITLNTVADINKGASGCQEGNAIEVRNAPFDGTHPNTQYVQVTHNVVEDYQKTGVLANGDVRVDVTENTISGLSPVPFIAQNGIQLGFGATGNVMRNHVDGNWFTGANWSSSGILMFEVNDVSIHHNTVVENQIGVAVEAWCWFAPSANNNKIIHNTLENNEYGVSVAAYVLGPGLSNCDPSADNNKVTNNSISTTDGEIGVFVGTGTAFCPCPSFTPSADNNKVIRNTISGYDVAVEDTGTTSKVHANVFSP